MKESGMLRSTPLHGVHVASGARMVPFSGWDLPVQYAGVIAEHNAVRTAAGLFDVSHMGEIELEGPGALASLQRLTCNDVQALRPGQAHYTAMLDETGGVIDDLIVYRRAEERFLAVVNAGNTATDFDWMCRVGQRRNCLFEVGRIFRQHFAVCDANVLDDVRDSYACDELQPVVWCHDRAYSKVQIECVTPSIESD